jgi:hypothetical protein
MRHLMCFGFIMLGVSALPWIYVALWEPKQDKERQDGK